MFRIYFSFRNFFLGDKKIIRGRGNDMIIIIGYYLILSGVVIESNKESKSFSPRLILILYKSESNIERS
jgi:hypothetical protein